MKVICTFSHFIYLIVILPQFLGQYSEKAQKHKLNSMNSAASYAIGDVSVGNHGLSAAVREEVYLNHRDYALAHNYSYYHQTERLGDLDSKYICSTKINLLKMLLTPPKKHHFVLLIDSDALFVNTKKSISELVSQALSKRAYGQPPPSLYFSGDTNAINSGALLFRRSKWTMELLDEIFHICNTMKNLPAIGMGDDNAALSVYLGGCFSNCTYEQFKRAYAKVDLGFNSETRRENKHIKKKIAEADPRIYESMLAPHVLSHVCPLPQERFQTYTIESAKYIVHFAGGLNKESYLRSALDELKKTDKSS